MACIRDIQYEILLTGATPDKCEKFIKENSDEFYHVPAGYRIRGVALVGGKWIPVGIKGSDLIFQFIKPCSGLFVLKIEDAQDEIERLRSSKEAKKA